MMRIRFFLDEDHEQVTMTIMAVGILRTQHENIVSQNVEIFFWIT